LPAPDADDPPFRALGKVTVPEIQYIAPEKLLFTQWDLVIVID
jgi:hypothetical protein